MFWRSSSWRLGFGPTQILTAIAIAVGGAAALAPPSARLAIFLFRVHTILFLLIGDLPRACPFVMVQLRTLVRPPGPQADWSASRASICPPKLVSNDRHVRSDSDVESQGRYFPRRRPSSSAIETTRPVAHISGWTCAYPDRASGSLRHRRRAGRIRLCRLRRHRSAGKCELHVWNAAS